jgi:hypothetical protein
MSLNASVNPYAPTAVNLDLSRTSEPVSPEMEALRVAAYSAFARDDDYVVMWRPLLVEKETDLPFNWAAAIFSTAWCCYRKMYWQALGIYIWGNVVTIAASLLYFFAFRGEEAVSPTSTLIVALAASVLLVRIPLGWFANWWYFRHASRRIQKSIDEHAPDSEAIHAGIRRRGGVSRLALGLVIAFHITVNLAWRVV